MTNTILFERQGDELRIRPAQRRTGDVLGDVVDSAETLDSLEFGIACSSTATQVSNRLALESLLDDILVAPFDAHAAKGVISNCISKLDA